MNGERNLEDVRYKNRNYCEDDVILTTCMLIYIIDYEDQLLSSSRYGVRTFDLFLLLGITLAGIKIPVYFY